jgi:hypothetical protein
MTETYRAREFPMHIISHQVQCVAATLHHLVWNEQCREELINEDVIGALVEILKSSDVV